ncbi:MAG: hypothetical protein FWC87_00030 [Acidimicrobiaceae bacterium]|nr:hypothetical protein [Acidimicrobiaceae bacterium]
MRVISERFPGALLVAMVLVVMGVAILGLVRMYEAPRAHLYLGLPTIAVGMTVFVLVFWGPTQPYPAPPPIPTPTATKLPIAATPFRPGATLPPNPVVPPSTTPTPRPSPHLGRSIGPR